MKELILQGVQLVLSIFEVWLCYQMLFCTVLEKENFGGKEKLLMWISVLGFGTALGLNRHMLFFSHIMHLFVSGLMLLFIWLMVRKNFWLIFGLIFSYFTVVALFDFFFAFLTISVIGDTFKDEVYFGISIWKVVIYGLTRVCMAAGIFLYLNRKRDILLQDINRYRTIFLIFSCLLFLILRRHQFIVYRMVMSKTEITGSEAAGSLFSAVFLVTFFLVLALKNRFIQKEKQLLLVREKLLEENYQILLKEMEKNRQITHDVKHHFLYLAECETNGEYEKIGQYLKEILKDPGIENGVTWTGNRMVDFILNQKKMEAEAENIKVNICASVILKLPVSETDSCVLFGNLLDNAIEACQRVEQGKRWINVQMEKKQGLFLIHISNSTDGKIIEKNGELLTSKKDKALHGYGLKSVYRVVYKNQGSLSLDWKDHVFNAYISFFDT